MLLCLNLVSQGHCPMSRHFTILHHTSPRSRLWARVSDLRRIERVAMAGADAERLRAEQTHVHRAK